MPEAEVVRGLTLRFEATEFALGVEVSPQSLLEVLRSLREQHGYRYYLCASATDREQEIELLHGVRRLDDADEMWVKVRLPKPDPEVDSAAFVYAGAEWHERELFDLFGVRFRAHPDPRRILMPDDYQGHPLLKDFPIDAPWGFRPPTGEEPTG
jgi:NADH:ubiquinone oxidoreductase subunit C